MLSKFELTNFKALREASFRLGRITVLIGENGTGKSSVGQALVTLRQSLGNQRLQTQGPLIKLGEYTDIVYESDVQNKLSFSLTFNSEQALPPFVEGPWSLEYSLTFENQSLDTHTTRITEGKDTILELVHDIKTGTQKQKVPFRWHRRDSDSLLRHTLTLQHRNEVGRPFTLAIQPNQPFIDTYGRAALDKLDTDAKRFQNTVFDALQKVQLVPALRGFESPEYKLTSPALDLTSAEPLANQAAAQMSLLVHIRSYEDELNSLISQVTNRQVRFRVIDGQFVALDVPRRHGAVSIYHEGFGTNQLVRLLLQVIAAQVGAIIIVEEPEIHLHPRAQVNLINVLIDRAKRDSKQLLLVTHSEHILIGLLNAVAEQRLSSDDLAVHYFSTDPTTGRPEAAELEVKPDGAVVGGLRGFFELELEEMDRYVSALSKARF